MEKHGSQETIAATPASVRYVSFSHIRMPKFKIEKIFHFLKYRKTNIAQCQNCKRQVEILWSRYFKVRTEQHDSTNHKHWSD